MGPRVVQVADGSLRVLVKLVHKAILVVDLVFQSNTWLILGLSFGIDFHRRFDEEPLHKTVNSSNNHVFECQVRGGGDRLQLEGLLNLWVSRGDLKQLLGVGAEVHSVVGIPTQGCENYLSIGVLLVLLRHGHITGFKLYTVKPP